MRQEPNRVLLKPVMIEALQALNEGLRAEDAEAIYSDLSTLSDNEEWQRRLRGAYSRRLKGEAKDKPVALIDFKRPDRNRYHVVRQFKVEAQRSRIADLVVFVNAQAPAEHDRRDHDLRKCEDVTDLLILVGT